METVYLKAIIPDKAKISFLRATFSTEDIESFIEFEEITTVVKDIKFDNKANVEKLNKFEADLILLIAETDKQELMDKFLDWQKQRIICNETTIEWLKQLKNY